MAPTERASDCVVEQAEPGLGYSDWGGESRAKEWEH